MQKILTWIDDRFPLTALWKEQVAEYYAPKNFNFWYFFGSLALFVLVMQIVTGIFLTMNYKPDATKAFESVEYIMRDVSGGWFIRYMHSTGASAFFIVVYLHMFRALLYGSYRKPRELLWIIGCFIYLALMAEAFFGYLLPWGQMSYWGAQVIVNLFSTVPLIGDDLGDLDSRRLHDLRRDAEPLLRVPRDRGAAGAAAAGRRAPDGAARGRLEQSGRHRDQGEQGSGDRPPARRNPVPSVLHGQGPGRRRRLPHRVFASSCSSGPTVGGYFLEANNFIPANPLQTPEHIAPVWYFTPYYAMLRAVPSFLHSQFWGVLVMGAAVVILFFLPWLDRRHGQVDPLPRAALQDMARHIRGLLPDPRLSRHRAGHRLGPVRRHDGLRPTALPSSRGFCTLVYFLFFLLMPWYTARDKTKPVPERVTWT